MADMYKAPNFQQASEIADLLVRKDFVQVVCTARQFDGMQEIKQAAYFTMMIEASKKGQELASSGDLQAAVLYSGFAVSGLWKGDTTEENAIPSLDWLLQFAKDTATPEPPDAISLEAALKRALDKKI